MTYHSTGQLGKEIPDHLTQRPPVLDPDQHFLEEEEEAFVEPTPEEVQASEDMKDNIRMGVMLAPLMMLACVGGIYLLIRNE